MRVLILIRNVGVILINDSMILTIPLRMFGSHCIRRVKIKRSLTRIGLLAGGTTLHSTMLARIKIVVLTYSN